MNPAIMILSESIKANGEKLRFTGLLLERPLFNMLCEHILAHRFPMRSYTWVTPGPNGKWLRAYLWGVTVYPKDQDQ
jgi:hypothetical protein